MEESIDGTHQSCVGNVKPFRSFCDNGILPLSQEAVSGLHLSQMTPVAFSPPALYDIVCSHILIDPCIFQVLSIFHDFRPKFCIQLPSHLFVLYKQKRPYLPLLFDPSTNIYCRSQWPHGVFPAAHLLGLWVRIPPGHGSLSLVSVVCC
jgi:hypothetical protein